MKKFYTDGSCQHNKTHQGGWGVVVVEDNSIVQEISGGKIGTTSNQMEMTAAIMALKEISLGEEATILSDSQYVIKGMSEWIKNWVKKNWKTAQKTDVLNKELWIELLNYSNGKKIHWEWVRGHAGNEFNERSDVLASKCIESNIKLKKNSISVEILDTNLIVRLDCGDIFFISDSSKKYIVVKTDIRVNQKNGFLAQLLSNQHGSEYDFFELSSGLKFSKITPSQNEKKVIFSTVEKFYKNTKEQFYQFSKKCSHEISEKHENSDECIFCGNPQERK